MVATDLSSIFLALSKNIKKSIHDTAGGTVRTFKSPRDILKARQSVGNNAYQLVNIPLVYHILPNQNDGTIGAGGKPSLADAQAVYATKRTNDLFKIYDRGTKQTVQFASFVQNNTIIHDNFVSNKDCGTLSEIELGSIVQKAADWESKFHVVVCESDQFSGVASLPISFAADNPLHNMVRVDYRAFACFDQSTGTYLCNSTSVNPATGKPKSHTRWWRTDSATIAHEIGHLFGLLHTFTGDSCFNIRGDGIPDTPHELLSSDSIDNCPGLLPYNKDRDLFQFFNRRTPNTGDAQTCGLTGRVCSSSTCAACCDPKNCNPRFINGTDVTEDDVSIPSCCSDPKPSDSCPLRRGIDPKNNIMSYVPDFCMGEFTAGQLSRMMAQGRRWKTIIYCNYANILDPGTCTDDIKCATTATNPRCKAR